MSLLKIAGLSPPATMEPHSECRTAMRVDVNDAIQWQTPAASSTPASAFTLKRMRLSREDVPRQTAEQHT